MKSPGPYLRKKFPKIYFFLTSLINILIRISRPYSIYITDTLGGSFKSYISNSDMNIKISRLKRDLDGESADTIDVIMNRIMHYPDESNKKKISKRDKIAGGLLPVESDRVRKETKRKLKFYRKKYKFLSIHIEESVFYYYHGLSLLPARIAEYIKDHDFIDLGAFVGDSAIALREFNYKKIFSVEMSHKSILKYKTNLARSNINEDKFEIINACITSNDDEEPVRLADTGSSGFSELRMKGKYDEISVDRKSLDYIVKKYKISPRFIKVDIEGNSLEFVKGAKNTLTSFRPVFSIAIYHNPYEFFEVKPLLEELLTDYVFMVRKLAGGIKNNKCHSEVVLLGYPKEIVD
jgi:FkbM family methyltransferase